MFLLENKSELLNNSPEKKTRLTSATKRFNLNPSPQTEVVGFGIKIERATKNEKPIEPQTESVGK